MRQLDGEMCVIAGDKVEVEPLLLPASSLRTKPVQIEGSVIDSNACSRRVCLGTLVLRIGLSNNGKISRIETSC